MWCNKKKQCSLTIAERWVRSGYVKSGGGSEVLAYFLIWIPTDLNLDPAESCTSPILKVHNRSSITFFIRISPVHCRSADMQFWSNISLNSCRLLNKNAIADILCSCRATFLSYIFLGFFFVYTEYHCRPSNASTRYCAIQGGYPPQDWQSLPCAEEELDSNPGLLICSQSFL